MNQVPTMQGKFDSKAFQAHRMHPLVAGLIGIWAMVRRSRSRKSTVGEASNYTGFLAESALAVTCALLWFFAYAVNSSVAQVASPPVHGLAIYGEPALKPGESLPYANPQAPKGGAVHYGEVGGFDSLNPWIVKGRAPWGVRALTVESLMVRSWDEPFTVYCLLCSSVQLDGASLRVMLNPKARFSDGSALTPEDVVFSVETLKREGRPNFRSYLNKLVELRAEPEENAVVFRFSEVDRELPLLIGLLPIFKAADWQGRKFSETTDRPIIGTGPYVIESMEMGRWINFRKNPQWWGRDLPINRGVHNFDLVRYEYFRDDNTAFEAFKAGQVHLYRETDAARWQDRFDFPAARDGRVIKTEQLHQRPSGMNGFVFNTRRPLFADLRVRQALTLAFDFEWINRSLYKGAYRRISSYYANSALAAVGAANGIERDLLLPYAATLPPGILDAPWSPPQSSADGRNRENLRAAKQLLQQAGWQVQEGVLRNAKGEAFSFEILLGDPEYERVAGIFVQSLKRLGIEARLRLVDSAQFQDRLNKYDYDMFPRRWWLTLAPGREQRFYFGAAGVSQQGTRNYMGADHPAIEAALDALENAPDQARWQAAVRALDRVLTAQLYVIPFWYDNVDRLAHWRHLRSPAKAPAYGYTPEVWWSAQ